MFWIMAHIVVGQSMSPAINEGDIVIIKKINPNKHKFRVGGVYCYRDFKNIIKKKYDRYNTELKYNGYIKRLKNITDNGNLYFLGDNAKNSYDSRNYGAVPKEAVYGKVIKVFKPKFLRDNIKCLLYNDKNN